MGAVLAPIIVGILGALGIIWSARLNSKTSEASALDARAQKILEGAMEYQGEEIKSLRLRIVDLETEVAACEKGRAADRERFDRDLAELRAEVRTLQGGAP